MVPVAVVGLVDAGGDVLLGSGRPSLFMPSSAPAAMEHVLSNSKVRGTQAGRDVQQARWVSTTSWDSPTRPLVVRKSRPLRFLWRGPLSYFFFFCASSSPPGCPLASGCARRRRLLEASGQWCANGRQAPDVAWPSPAMVTTSAGARTTLRQRT